MEALRAWIREHPLAVDCAVALAFFALGLLSTRIAYDVGAGQRHNFRFAAGVACMALLTLPLAVRRRRPPLSLIGLTVGVLGYTIFGVTEGATSGTAGFLAIYSVGAYCTRRVANWVRGVCITVALGDLLWVLLFRQLDLGRSKASVIGAGLLVVGSNVFFFFAAWAIGDVARISRSRAAELAQRNAELRAAQDVIAEKAVLDERVHIAREVHDVVAHHVSVMGVQAGAARRVMARDPEKAAEVLSAIEASSRQAVAELQRLLGFLRRETGPVTAATRPPTTAAGPGAGGGPEVGAAAGRTKGGGTASGADTIGPAGTTGGGPAGARGLVTASGRGTDSGVVTGGLAPLGAAVAAPQPSLSQLDLLVAEMNEAGLVVSTVTQGTPRPVPPSVDLSAYRVTQEALTNALKHAGAGTAAVVTLHYAPDRLELSIVDDGRGRSNGRTDLPTADPTPSGGHGLVGMRERVALSGGQFQAAHTRGSGFAVTATFPLSSAFQRAT